MIDREHDLPITKQAKVLRISRGSVYYLPRPVSATDLEVMRRLDRLHLEFPFAGSRMLQGLLSADGCEIGRRHVKTLMRRMGIEALYRRPRTTKPEPGHKIYPYLLRGMEITRPNQVWAMDITYIPMARGFVYLAVVLDWFSRRVLSWRVSISMEAAFCVETLEDAWLVTASRRYSIRTRVRSSRARPSPACLPTTALRSAWTAKGLGGTMSSSSGCGAASNTRRCISGPTTASARPALRSAVTSTSTTQGAHIRALTARHQIKPTSPRCHSAWQPNPGRGSTYRRGKIVQRSSRRSCATNSAPTTLPTSVSRKGWTISMQSARRSKPSPIASPVSKRNGSTSTSTSLSCSGSLCPSLSARSPSGHQNPRSARHPPMWGYPACRRSPRRPSRWRPSRIHQAILTTFHLSEQTYGPYAASSWLCGRCFGSGSWWKRLLASGPHRCLWKNRNSCPEPTRPIPSGQDRMASGG